MVIAQGLPAICMGATDIKGRSQTSYTAPCNDIVSHVAQIGGIRVFPTTHVKTNAKDMRPQSSCTVRRLRMIAPDKPWLF